MQKLLTKLDVLNTKTGVEYYKLTFGKQFFMMMPWDYEKAGLMELYNKLPTLEEGVEYDIKWREAKFKGVKKTLLTQLQTVEPEFEWFGEEMGNEPENDSSDTPSEFVESSPQGFNTQGNTMYQVEAETPPSLFDDEFEDIPF